MQREDALLRGVVAGFVGTLAMTFTRRLVAPSVLPPEMVPREIVPERIVRWTEAQAGVPHALERDDEKKVAMVPHLGYGVTMGAAYGLLRGRRAGVNPVPAGMLFGLAVLAVGYQGWLPALGIQRPLSQKPPEEWVVPVLSHLVYGAATALAYERLGRTELSDPGAAKGAEHE